MRIGNTLYFDYQASTPVDPRVLTKMSPYFERSFGNPHSVDHTLGWESSKATDTAASQVAALIGADADEIIFTSGATESNNLALLGLARRARGRKRLLVSAIEHKCVLASARIAKDQLGLVVDYLPVDREGRVDMTVLGDTLNDDVLAVSVMAVNNEIGTIQDIPYISQIVKEHGAVFHCDAAQAPCAVTVQNYARYADLISLSAHKMHGPKGIGTLFVRRELQSCIEPGIYGGGQQGGLRSGTLPVPLCVGMGEAARLLSLPAAEDERERLQAITDRLVAGLLALKWPVSVNGPAGDNRHPGNSNICFRDFSAHDILGAMQPRLAASTSSACSSGLPEPSHVLRAIGLAEQEAEASIRFSPGPDTTEEEVDEAVGLIDETLERLSETQAARFV